MGTCCCLLDLQVNNYQGGMTRMNLPALNTKAFLLCSARRKGFDEARRQAV